MISIRYNNEIVDILPNQQLERTMNNPMFLIDNILAEYSTPFIIAFSERNVRNFGMLFFDLSIKKKEKFEVQVFDYNSFAFNATLVIETAKVDRRVSGRSNANGYLLSGISSFLSKIKDVKANTLQLGGERVIPYTTGLPLDGSNGYVQQFQATWDNTADYLVAPIRNDQWLGEVDDPLANGWMNILDNDGNLMPLQAYVLQPRLKYVLEQLFLENGWVLDTSGMAGTDWENIFLFSVKPLFTSDVTWTQNFVGSAWVNLPTATVRSEVRIHLAEWISPEVTCSELLIEICKKYGWVPLCNNDNNICRLIPLKYAKSGQIKDWTKYASGQVESDFSGDPKVFAFKNTMPSNDTFPAVPSFENLTFGEPVLKKGDLPSPLGNYDNTIIYSYRENQWFKIELDASNQRVWAVFADNIYDQDVAKATDTFETKVSTLPMYRTKYRTSGGIDYYGLFAYCKQSRNKEWGLRTLVYHGMVHEVKADGTVGAIQYPYLSSIRVLPDGTEHMDWSNVLRHKYGDNDYGIIEYWFQSWTDLVGLIETDDQRLFLPIHVLYNFRWDDIINIFNVPYLVKSYIEPRAYPGYIQAKLQRLTLDKFDAEGAPAAADLYLKMVIRNQRFSALIDPYGGLLAGVTYTDVVEADWIIEIYADAAGTIPTLPTVPITVNIEATSTNEDGSPPVVTFGPYLMNTLGELLVLGTPFTIHDYLESTLNMPPSFHAHVYRAYRLLPGTGYRIIT